LTKSACPPIPSLSVGRTAAPAKPKGCRGGKSGLRGQAVPDNIRRARAQGKCHREQTAAGVAYAAARVKRCGKSAPRRRQRRRHGKPHREQDRIGTACRLPRASANAAGSMSRSARPGRLLEAPGNRRPRGMAVAHAGLPACHPEPGLQLRLDVSRVIPGDRGKVGLG